MKLPLDTGVLGHVCHPRKHQDVRAWYDNASKRHEIVLSVVASYELRRSLLRIGSLHSLRRLDEIETDLRVIDTTAKTWRTAAELWAAQRRAGRGAGDAALDADLLIAAQALGEGAVVVTYNLRHFEGVVEAQTWADVPLS